MLDLNGNYKLLNDSYLFPKIKEKVNKFKDTDPNFKILNLGEGDTTRPLTATVYKSMSKKLEDMYRGNGYMGYSNPLGLDSLRLQIANFYKRYHSTYLSSSEIFINDGAKSDLFNIQTIFKSNLKIALQNPSYPVYTDSVIINGNSLVFLEGNRDNNFIPSPPEEKVDIIYLCFPNNPTGTTAGFDQLKIFVDYAINNNTLIIFDAVCSWFIRNSKYPKSIYEIPSANECAIEIQSLSKIASFPSLRLGWTVIPNGLKLGNFVDSEIANIWKRKQQTSFNGSSIISQVGAEAVLTLKGLRECNKNIEYYLQNANFLKKACIDLGLNCYGANDSPYVWCQTPNKMKSWDFFDFLLRKRGIVCTPGEGFGSYGEGYFRLSGFASKEETLIASQRISEAIKIQ